LMKAIQDFQKQLDKEMGWTPKGDDFEYSKAYLPYIHMLLTTEIAEIAEEIRMLFIVTNRYIEQGFSDKEAFKMAKEEVQANVGKEIADCLAYLSKFANFFDVDMEIEYFSKMKEVKDRNNGKRGY
jgi:NTP pyrophosphatase (non-canonical NTP hydrolase)